MEAPVAHVGDPLAVGGEPRVERAGPVRQRTHIAPEQVGHEELTAQHERGEAHLAVGVDRGDALGRLTQPLPARPLGRREVAVAGSGQFFRVSDEPLRPHARLIGLEHAETGDGVIAAIGAEEHDALAVGSDANRPRLAEREATGAGVLAWERVRGFGVGGVGGAGHIGGHGVQRATRAGLSLPDPAHAARPVSDGLIGQRRKPLSDEHR